MGINISNRNTLVILHVEYRSFLKSNGPDHWGTSFPIEAIKSPDLKQRPTEATNLGQRFVDPCLRTGRETAQDVLTLTSNITNKNI